MTDVGESDCHRMHSFGDTVHYDNEPALINDAQRETKGPKTESVIRDSRGYMDSK